MKKFKRLSLFLCLTVLLQCILLPASATETTVPAESTEAVNTEIPFGSVSILNGCRTIEGMVPLGGSERRLASSQAAFVYEKNTGTVIYSYNPDMKLSPGTLTKIVTALVAIENCELDEVVTCSEGIQSRVPGSSLKMSPNLKSGEQLTVEDLLHGLLLLSANDAAVALAEHVAGTTDAYREMMNQRVKQMGCFNTEFGNISGLDTATSYTTARDMAKIVTEATKNETFAEIFGEVEYTVPATNMVETERKFYTTNYLMDQHNISQFYDDRVKGGLASYTELSGASLACTAENDRGANSLSLVCVTLGGTRIYNEEETWRVDTYGNFDEMVELIKYAFESFKVNRIIYEGMSLSQFSVIDGESYAVGQPFENIDSAVPIDASMDNLYMNYKVREEGLTAPIAKDELIATMEVWYRNSCVAEAEVFSMGDVKAASNTGVDIRTTATRDDSDSSGFLSVLGTICVIILGLAMAYLAFNAYMRSRMRARRRKRREARRRNR